jgi:hypothetical protein
MNTWIRFITAAAIVVPALPQPLHTALITGAIGFGGNVTIDTSSAATATAVTGWLDTQVLDDSGTFASFVTPVAPAYFNNSQIWNFNTSTPITNFLSVRGFTFELQSSYVVAQGGTPGVSGYAAVDGNGMATSNGFTPTAFHWSFTFQDPKSGSNPDQWTFSAEFASANSNGAPVLVCNAITNATVLTWNDPTLTLQSAPALAGTYTNVPGATSPYTNRIIGPTKFFRLNQ